MIRLRTLAAAAVLALTLTACQPADNSSSSSSGGGTLGGGTGGAPAPTAGNPNPYDNGTDDSCFFKLSPLDTGIATGASIKGTVELYCKVPPQSHSLHLQLQREVNGAWANQADRVWNDIPPNIPVFKLATASCVPGSWRVVVSVHGVSATGKTFTHDGFTGMTKKVDASDCG